MDGNDGFSREIWDMKYRFKQPDGMPVDKTVDQSWKRVAKALARPEATDAAGIRGWQRRFYKVLKDFTFLPAGRILSGAGTDREVTLFNCFVMGQVPDDMSGIFLHLREAALTMQQGGGIGYDFSTLRPKGALVAGVGADAAGPLAFMEVWDAMCATIKSAGARRGAMMATLACDHPDIEAFITAKQTPGRLTNFNLSVLVSDAFMAAVRADDDWTLQFDGKAYDRLRARDLWDGIMRATYEAAEPGVIFIDRINARNNLYYCEAIRATNPCGEQPLPPYGACLLGSVNLARLVDDPFTDKARLNEKTLAEIVPVAVRMLDNAIDASRFPLEAQQQEALAKRRIGLGVTGLADALIYCGVRYGSTAAVALTERWLKLIRDLAYRASVDLAREKGPFPLFDADAYLAGPTVAALDGKLRKLIKKHGIRNALLTSIAPTGTISLLAGNVSSGIEPVFAFRQQRRVLDPDGRARSHEVVNSAYARYREAFGEDAELPDYFVDAQSLTPADHLAMQAAAQAYVDSSISKTINLPEDISFEDFKDVYARAYAMDCKGCTTYRPNAITGAVLSVAGADDAQAPPQQSLPAARDMEGDVVYMAHPLDRPGALEGRTYKLRWPDSDHAIYITVNDIMDGERRRPFEVFINSKNMEHYAWTVALTRMISAVFRRGGDVAFVVEELKAVFDPRGGYWLEGSYVPSLLAAIGGVIERHMLDIGFLSAEEAARIDGEEGRKPVDPAAAQAEETEAIPNGRRHCPRCAHPGLIRQEGCDTCSNCGWSRCA